MKNLIYLLLLLIILPLAWSCDKDEETQQTDNNFPIPEGWIENDDLSKLKKVY